MFTGIASHTKMFSLQCFRQKPVPTQGKRKGKARVQTYTGTAQEIIPCDSMITPIHNWPSWTFHMPQQTYHDRRLPPELSLLDSLTWHHCMTDAKDVTHSMKGENRKHTVREPAKCFMNYLDKYHCIASWDVHNITPRQGMPPMHCAIPKTLSFFPWPFTSLHQCLFPPTCYIFILIL